MVVRRKPFDLNESLLTIAEAIQAGARAPNIKKYKPHEKQYQFHASKRKKKLYIGGNRSGKTTGGVTEAIWRATCTHPYRPDLNAIGPNRGRVAAVDFINGIEKIIFPQYKQWLYPSALRGGSWEQAYDKNTKTLVFSNGSTIEFMSYDQDLDKFAGTSRHWIHFDEECPKPIYTECRARLVDTNGDFWITMTPVEGITWIYEDLFEPNYGKEDGDVEIIEINTLENPYLSAEGISNLMEGMDEDDVRTRVGGSFVRQGGRVYKNFDPTPGFAQVLKEPIRDPKTYFPERNWLWILSMDHGLNNPSSFHWSAVNDDGFIITFDEWYKNELDVKQHAEIVLRKIRQHGRFPDLLVGDPSISQRNGVTATSIQEEYQKYGLSFTLGNNDVKSGIVRVKRYLNPAIYPGELGRKRHPIFGGTQDLPMATDDVRANATPDGKYYRLNIDPKCEKLIWEMKQYRWKTYADKKKQFENNPYDEPHKKNDHACDDIRYLIMTRPDLAANSNEVGEVQLREAMAELDQKMTSVANWDIDDPRGVLNGNGEPGTWMPGQPLPGENFSGWEIDEHMGGIF